MSDNRVSRTLQGFAVVMMGLMGSAAHATETTCGVGEVCDTRNNGRGIYVRQNGKYCLRYDATKVFCPEAFEPSPSTTTPLVLRGRLLLSGAESVTRLTVKGDLLKPSPLPVTVPVQVLKVGPPTVGDPSKLVITYRESGSVQIKTLEGASLPLLTLKIGGTPVSFDVKFTQVGVPDSTSKLHRYRARYTSGTNLFTGDLCADPAPTQPPQVDTNAISFLPGRSVDGNSGIIADASGTTTLACGTGAIVTCMNWGYVPWNSGLAAAPTQTVTELLGACIQAKRAAFYVGVSDYNTYTVEGTQFQLHDKWLRASVPASLEAFWRPTGATCVNLENWRGKGGNQPPPPDRGLPKCEPAQVGQSVFATGSVAP